MEGWQFVKLESACLKIQDGAHHSPKNLYASPEANRFPYITSKNIRNGYLDLTKLEYVDAEFHKSIYPRCNPELGDVLLTKDGANTGNVTLNTLDQPFSLLSSVCLIKTDPQKLLPRWLMYYIQSNEGFASITGAMTGAAIKRIILKTIKASTIPLPPLPEQKRIVAILDEAFEGIDKAIANTEKNLANAKELLEVRLREIFSSGGGDWISTTFGECLKLRSGDGLTAKAMLPGPYPVYGGNGIAGHHNAYNLEGDHIIIGRVGALCGNARHIVEKIWLTDNAFKVTEKRYDIDNNFLTHLLNFKQLRTFARQAAQPVISNSSLEDVALCFPKSVEKQVELAANIDTLTAEVEQITQVWGIKIAQLLELKKSFLAMAFSGRLMSAHELTEAAE